MKNLLGLFAETQTTFQDTGQAETALEDLKQRGGLSDAAFLITNLPTTDGDGTYALSTYSKEWHKHYIARSYLDIDPIVQNALTRITPFSWEIPNPSSELKKFFGEAGEFGISAQGFSVPIRGIRGDIGVFSISADLSPKDWLDYRKEMQSEIMLLGYYYYMACLDIDFPENRDVVLSPREYDILSWAAKGKATFTIAEILSLSPKTIEHYLASSRVKLRAANTTHAVAKAVRWGLIDPLG